MKITKTFFALVCGSMIFASCGGDSVEDFITGNDGDQEQEEIVGEPLTEITVKSTETTRTALGADGLAINWSTNDQLAVAPLKNKPKSKYGQFTLVEGEGTTKGKFVGSADAASMYAAIYPYGTYTVSAEATYARFNNVEIPTNQRAVANGFDPKAGIMYALFAAADDDITFNHVCSYAKITVPACQKITLSDKKTTTPISGKFNVRILSANANIDINPTTDTKPYVNLVPATVGGTIPAGTYLIAFNPASFKEGLQFVVDLDGTNKLVRETSGTNNVNLTGAGKSIDFGTASVSNNWIPKTDTYTFD